MIIYTFHGKEKWTISTATKPKDAVEFRNDDTEARQIDFDPATTFDTSHYDLAIGEKKRFRRVQGDLSTIMSGGMTDVI